MKRSSVKNIWFIVLAFSYLSSYSQESNRSELGGCSQGTANSIKKLDINNIEAAVLTCGDMHWDLNSNYRYRFPKGTTKYCSGPSGLWIGAYSNNNLRTACQTYRQSGTDFWPGPLDPITVDITAPECNAYDYIWKIDYTTINDFIAHFNNGTIQSGAYPINSTIQNWPMGQQTNLAPFVDVNNNGIYDPQTGGDYPEIKGDQSLFYVFNDKGNSHQGTGSPSAMGLQVNAMPYAYGCATIVSSRPELMNTTFYNYKVINHSLSTYTDTYIGVWVDASIGDETNDFVGTNPKGGYAYAYNGTSNDNVYGQYSPAVGTVILKAPIVGQSDGIDNDLDTVIDEINESFLIPNMYYFNSTRIVMAPDTIGTGDPFNYFDYYRYLTGKWKTDSAFVCGGIGYPSAGTGSPVKHVFPGLNSIDTICNSNWTEISAGNVPGNRSYLLSMGPFTFNAHDTTEIEFAFVTSIDSTQPGNSWASVLKLEEDVRKVKEFYNMTTKPSCLESILSNIKVPESIETIAIYPNPIDEVMTISSTRKKGAIARVSNVLGQVVVAEFNLLYGNNQIDLKNLSSGIYFLQIKKNDLWENIKVIKE